MLKQICSADQCSVYEINDGNHQDIVRLIASSDQTRQITNDPFVVGLNYTNLLKNACAAILKNLQTEKVTELTERQTVVLNILRGGLNFGLREALGEAFGWNEHGSAFLSAQRVRNDDNPEKWHITESGYHKVYLPENAAVVCGDVVATGTSLHYALKELLATVKKNGGSLASILFFTIGGKQTETILADIHREAKQTIPGYRQTIVVYLEGCFQVAAADTKLSIKIDGTDLIRCGSLLAPEFIESQYQDPSFPIERCTIYDAGSRAFWLPEYYEDLACYWQQVQELAEQGVAYQQLLAERFPELDAAHFAEVNLKEICRIQLAKLPAT